MTAATATIEQIKPAALARKVDQLGDLNAQIADLTHKAASIKDALIKSGLPEVEGKKYRAVISHKEVKRLDAAKARTFLSPQQLRACTKIGETTSVSVYDR